MGHEAPPLGLHLPLDASDASQVAQDNALIQTDVINAEPSSAANIPSAASLIKIGKQVIGHGTRVVRRKFGHAPICCREEQAATGF